MLISGIQHFAYCRRQWALIHIEQQWSENVHTAEGRIFHARADEPGTESRGDRLIVRGMRVQSNQLQMTGVCDVVEFHKDPEGVWIPQWNDTYSVIPIEYKKGSAATQAKKTANEMQLCAEAMCLEEMLMCKIQVGYMYYGETRHRTEVEFTNELRDSVSSAVKEMWSYWSRGYTPKVKPHRGCKSCSLMEICLAESFSSVEDYINRSLD